MRQRRTLPLIAALVALAAPASAATLQNARLRADFDGRGLVALAATQPAASVTIARDGFSVTIDGTTYDAATLPPATQQITGDAIAFTYASGRVRLRVRYTLPRDGAFVRKAITILETGRDAYRVDRVTVFDSELADLPEGLLVHGPGRASLGQGAYAAAVRLPDGRSLLALAENPFLDVTSSARALRIAYAPDMTWRQADGPFVADAGLLAPVLRNGRRQPAAMAREWELAGAGQATAADGLDEAEVAGLTAIVRASLLHRPERPTNVFVGWCVNDYQIDIATEAGRTEYKRVMDRAAELGADHVLFAPTNSAVAKRDDSTDDWRWENLLWLGLGQRIRQGTWVPGRDPLPDSVREMLDHARARRLGLIAYVYPVLAFQQDPSWLVTRPNPSADARQYASLGHRHFQDWLIETLVAFHGQTGIAGYSFDHGFLTFAGPGRYAQWRGWRRVMEELRRRIPSIVIDGRQAYHLYGPWSWLAGSYPHPTYNDEQPESFVPFPDLSFDRVSAARQRYTAWQYRNHDFAPSEIVPGYITHQTPRLDETGDMPQTKTPDGIRLDRFRARDWDHLGWRYSLLSSIATGGWNNVLNMIPARDPEEYRHFSADDRAFFRKWIDWTAEHRELLRHTRTILGQPAIGKADGTAAIVKDRGYIFLFNPNARAVRAEVVLDERIGLTAGGRFRVKEIWPLEHRLIGKPGAGFWNHRDTMPVLLEGQSAVVLEIEPAAAITAPLLFGAPGTASFEGERVVLHDVRGPAGTGADLIVLAPGRSPQTVRVRFAGERFDRAQQVGTYDPTFAGGRFEGSFRVPSRVFAQLEARQRAWPIPWTPEDYRTTWLAPHRLLLYVQFAEPDDAWTPQLRIDGRVVELKRAYSSIRVHRRSFVGFYADLSLLQPDREYRLELDLPTGLKPGQFQGVFFQNVETEYTPGAVAK
jgi:hypothetical protein